MEGFRKFILRGNVVELAVGVVIGVAFANVVTAMVKDLITPLLGIFGGVPDFSSLSFSINNSRFLIGDFINALLSFLVIAAVVYYLAVVPYTRLTESPKPRPPATKECPECLSSVPLAARRCAFCTALLPNVGGS
jgi:large conductance mechanosensitive channel